MKNIFLHLGFILILAGLSIICVDKVSASIKDYYSDVEKSNEIVEIVNTNYNTFKDKSIEVKSGIVEVSKSFNLYLEDFPKKNEEIVLKVKKVEEDINELSTTTDTLLNYCEYNLNNNVMDKQCASFKTNFNNMMDSYEEMLKVYNDVINSYNDFSKENGKVSIEEYKENLDSSIVEASAKLK